MSTASETEVSALNMKTAKFGHTCNFSWTLRNISQIGNAERKFHFEFKLHPTCDVTWQACALYNVPNELLIGYQPQRRPCWTKIGPGSTLGIYNTNGDLYSSQSFDWSKPCREELAVLLKKPKNEGEPIITEDGKIFEILDDTLVIKGSVVVSDCCSRTVLCKPESTSEGFLSLLCSAVKFT